MKTYDDVVNLALRRSIFYPASEIYANAPAGFYSYGPYGVTIKQKLVELWRRLLVRREEMLEIDSAVTMPEDVFRSSGHLSSFADPITECTKCHARYRADQLLTERTGHDYKEKMSDEELTEALTKYKVTCTKCTSALSSVQRSSLMVKAEIGSSRKNACYLRPEACQSIFVDFARLYKTMRIKLPKGIAQIGKAYRNEISPRQTLLRQIEFSQMDLEVFFDPKHINEAEHFDDIKTVKLNVQLAKEKEPTVRTVNDLVKKNTFSGKLIAYYLARTQQFYEACGFSLNNTRFRQLDDEERAFYAKEGWDFEVNTSLGWLELSANNYRTDYDLKGHQEGSKQDLSVVNEENGEKFIPHLWETSMGPDRIFYAVLEHAFRSDDKRTWLALPLCLVPLEAGVFPLLSNKPDLIKKAQHVEHALRQQFVTFFDVAGSIGKRYARMDEIGVPFCITVDFDTLNDDTVTVRYRDTAEQKRVKINDVVALLTQEFQKGI